MDAGDHKVILNNPAKGLSLTKGNYMCQVTVVNAYGRYHQCKVLTVISSE